jgi:ribonucleoside-diphosphate reductase subunit M2
MPGLAQSNEFIARDELIHTKWGAELYSACTIKPSREELVAIVNAGVDLAKAFARDVLVGGKLSLQSMLKHIEYQADRVLALVNEPPIYGVGTDFTFMLQLDLPSQTDFFHHEVTSYTIGAGDADDGSINTDI